MKWQIRQIPENYNDEVIKGLYFVTNGQPVPDDTYFCRDGQTRSLARPVDKSFKRLVASHHDTKTREIFTTHNECAYYNEYYDAVHTLRMYQQEFVPGITSDRLTKAVRKNEQSTEQA